MINPPQKDTQTVPEKQTPPLIWQPFPDLGGLRGGISLKSDGGMSWSGMKIAETAQNRRRYFERFRLDANRIVSADQIHGTHIQSVSSLDCGRGALNPESRIPETDALITCEPEVILSTLHADCAPIFYYDPIQRVIGLAHAGWRGILAGLPGLMLRRLFDEYHSANSDALVAVGPMVSPEHYPVDDQLASRFVSRFGDSVIRSISGQPHLDLFNALSMDLLQSGLPAEKLPSRPPCTASSLHYASYRRDGGESRSMMAWLMIR